MSDSSAILHVSQHSFMNHFLDGLFIINKIHVHIPANGNNNLSFLALT